MTTPIQTIKDAIAFLDARCDGAHAHDRQGFNGRDTDFGKSLAEALRNGKGWSEKQLRAAFRVAQTYRNSQLAPAGIVLPTKDELEAAIVAHKATHKAAKASQVGVTVRRVAEGMWFASWPFGERDRCITELQKAAPADNREWDAKNKNWVIYDDPDKLWSYGEDLAQRLGVSVTETK